MAVNLLDLAKSALNDQTIGKLAGALGQSEAATKSAVDVAVPALLGSLLKGASNPQTAQGLFNELKGLDLGFLNNLGSLLGSGGQSGNALTSLGNKFLPMLLGANADSIFSTVSKLSGVSSATIKSLLTMLAPVLMGLIGKQIKSGNLDLKGMTDLLVGQKQSLAKHLPKELGGALGIADLLGATSSAVQSGSKAAAAAAQSTANAGAGILRWLIPLLIAAVGLFAIWKFVLRQPPAQPVDNVKQGTTQVGEGVPSKDGFNLAAASQALGTAFGGLTTALGSVTDEASAKAVLPKFADVERALGGFQWDSLSATNRTALTGVLKPLVASLKGAIDKLVANPALKAVIEPAYQTLQGKLDAMLK